MGRVSRYKKLKSCDPFAKKKPVVVDPKYDQEPVNDDFGEWSDNEIDGIDEQSKYTGNVWKEASIPPPEAMKSSQASSQAKVSSLVETDALPATSSGAVVSEEKERTLSKRSQKRMRKKESNAGSAQDIVSKAQLLMREDKLRARELRAVTGPAIKSEWAAAKRLKDSKPQIEGRREGESMREFKLRAKKEGKALVIAVKQSQSVTVSKKKGYLAERKEELKQKKREQKQRLARENGGGGDGEGDGAGDYSHDQTGSDPIEALGKLYFPSKPKASVGLHRYEEALMAPPSFSNLPRGAAQQKKKHHEQLLEQQQQQQQSVGATKRKRGDVGVDSSSSSSSGSDREAPLVVIKPGGSAGGSALLSSSKKAAASYSSSSGSHSGSGSAEMEALRARVLGAYREQKQRKRDDFAASSKGGKGGKRNSASQKGPSGQKGFLFEGEAGEGYTAL
mmetsp:Transcript_268/g.497  ORF Transcript_268/g.497 Transcript_268/m.497 type:complete len:449 (+) Transcript_268:16-1362(+)